MQHNLCTYQDCSASSPMSSLFTVGSNEMSPSRASDYSCIFSVGKRDQRNSRCLRLAKDAQEIRQFFGLQIGLCTFVQSNVLRAPPSEVGIRFVISCETQITAITAPRKWLQVVFKSLPSEKLISKIQNNLPFDSDILDFEEIFNELRSTLQSEVNISHNHMRLQLIADLSCSLQLCRRPYPQELSVKHFPCVTFGEHTTCIQSLGLSHSVSVVRCVQVGTHTRTASSRPSSPEFKICR